MTPENAISYIQSVFDKYQEECKYYVFVDSTLPKHYLYEVFPYLIISENAVLLYEARADFTKEEIKLMTKYHIRLLIVGIESFSSKALELLNKGKNAFDNIRFLKDCRQYGIAVNWNILVGIPGETDEMIHDNLQVSRSLSHLYPPTGVWLISFQGNCDYTTHNEEYNIKLVPDIASLAMVYPFPSSVLEKMTYFHKPETQSLTRTQAVLIQKLSKTINQWKNRWFNADFNDLPGLYFNDKKTVIDTRQGNRVVIHLDAVDYAILSHLNEPLSLYELQENIQIQDSETLEHKMKTLIDYGLLFTERGLYLSLVTEKYEMDTCREK